MTAVKAQDVEAALKRLDSRVAVVLVYGPDTGLVAERARRAAESAVTDPADPFALVRLDGETIASDPGRLADETRTVGLFGGKRAIWIRPTSRPIHAAVGVVLEDPSPDTLVVVEAGDLAKTSPLRTLCERSPRALALPCFADDARSLGAVLDESLKAAGLAIDRDARAAAVERLGGDRLASRGEIEKLLLYMHGTQTVSLEDVEAALSDVSGIALDALVDGAFLGDRATADASLRRLRQEGATAASILSALLRHAFGLLPVSMDVARGASAKEAAAGWRGLFFKRQGAVERQLGLWRPPALRRIIDRLQAAILETRREADLADAIVSRVILEIAAQARSSRT